MKPICLLIVVMLMYLTPSGYCQAPGEQIARSIISSGGYNGVQEKALSKLGDAAAVAITKVLAETDPSSSNIDSALSVIHLAFAAPQLIEGPSDRQPTTTLFVLKYLALATTDVRVKQRLAETRQYVLNQAAKAVPADTR